LNVILHGGSGGIDSSFIKKLFETSVATGNSAVMFNFLYLERGDEHSSGPELKEELATLREILKFCDAEKFKRIRLIGKSLGGIVASYFLRSIPQEEVDKYSVIILGYVLGDVDLRSFPGEIIVIQGEKDKFGNIETVKKDLSGTANNKIKYYEIQGADHSYRNPETKEHVYEDTVIGILKTIFLAKENPA